KKYCYFGNGLAVRVVRERTIGEDDRGSFKTEFVFRINGWLKLAYPEYIKQNTFDGQFVKRVYSEEFIHKADCPINDTQVVFILCDFLGENTKLTKVHDKLLKEIERKTELIKIQGEAIIELQNMLGEQLKKDEKYVERIKRTFAPVNDIQGKNIDHITRAMETK
ncbi:MAG: hypothetical protein AABY22_33945, partial [Nanoarchaeota archaeon]